jgi:hypothetical protein
MITKMKTMKTKRGRLFAWNRRMRKLAAGHRAGRKLVGDYNSKCKKCSADPRLIMAITENRERSFCTNQQQQTSWPDLRRTISKRWFHQPQQQQQRKQATIMPANRHPGVPKNGLLTGPFRVHVSMSHFSIGQLWRYE